MELTEYTSSVVAEIMDQLQDEADISEELHIREHFRPKNNGAFKLMVRDHIRKVNR